MLRFLTPLVLLLVGCPTPPESSVGAGGGPGGQPANGGGGGGAQGGSPGGVAPATGEVDGTSTTGAFVVADLPDELKNRPLDGDQPTPEEAQAKIRAGDHVLISGEIVCTDCKGQLVVNVAPFVEPSLSEPLGPTGSTPTGEGVEFAPMIVKGAGAFQIAVPKHAGKVVLEVIDDVDGNGLPSPGERLAVLHQLGKLTADKNHSGLKVDFSKKVPTPMSNVTPPPIGDGEVPPPVGGGEVPPPVGDGAVPPPSAPPQ
jgi:hypothetical protein